MESPAKCSAGGKSSENEAGAGLRRRMEANSRSIRVPNKNSQRKKKPRALDGRARGLKCGCAEFYGVMVTFTVTAGLVTPPDAGVIAMVEAFDDGPEPLQPATRMNTSMAPAIPTRVRNRRTAGSINNRAIASIMKSTCRSNADGGAFKDCGGTMNEVAEMD